MKGTPFPCSPKSRMSPHEVLFRFWVLLRGSAYACTSPTFKGPHHNKRGHMELAYSCTHKLLHIYIWTDIDVVLVFKA